VKWGDDLFYQDLLKMAALKRTVVNDSAERAIALIQKYYWVYNKK